MISAPLHADPLAPYAIEELRSGDELDCVIVMGPAIGRVKMSRTDPDRGRARGEILRDALNTRFGEHVAFIMRVTGMDRDAAIETARIDINRELQTIAAVMVTAIRRNPEPGTRNPQPPQEAAL